MRRRSGLELHQLSARTIGPVHSIILVDVDPVRLALVFRDALGRPGAVFAHLPDGAIARARKGEGPTMIECKTYRWYGHSEIDPADYRTQEELEHWKQRDPVPIAEKILMDKKILTTEKREAFVEEINADLETAVKTCEKEEYVPPEEAYNDVYSENFPVRRDEY